MKDQIIKKLKLHDLSLNSRQEKARFKDTAPMMLMNEDDVVKKKRGRGDALDDDDEGGNKKKKTTGGDSDSDYDMD